MKIIFKNSRLQFVTMIARPFYLLIICAFFIQTGLFSQVKMDMAVKKRDTSNTITIHQEVKFKATPEQIYQTLLSTKKFNDCTKKSFAMFTDHSAVIDSSLGGTFSLFDGHIIGRIIELVPNQRIVEAWRVVDWPAGIYSIANFEFTPKGTGTLLIFDHTGFPDGLKQHLAAGWQEHYWDALNNYFR